MKAYKLIAILIALFTIFQCSKVNKYKVTYVDNDRVEFVRKGKTIVLPNTGYYGGSKVNDSITVYGDYDFNWEPLNKSNF